MSATDVQEVVRTELLISEITEADRQALAALWERYDVFRGVRGTLDFIEMTWQNPTSTILLGKISGALISSVTVGYDGHQGWIYGICVDQPARRHGHGRATIVAAENWLRGRGAGAVALQVRFTTLSVLGFYDKLGYSFQNMVLLGRNL
ncbi:MAG: GNAT family N-acetyltransferase [Afipia sp.]|nr:GNAT family N-acetyltransferase [Afipia sp.]